MAPTINVTGAGKVPVLYYVAGAGGIFVAYTLYRRFTGSKNSASAPATSTTTPVVAASSYGSNDTAAIVQLQQAIDQLNKNQTTSPSSTTTAAAITAGAITGSKLNEKFVGSGWVPDDKQAQKVATPVSANNHVYTAITDLFQAATIGGANLYYQPLPGLFTSIPGNSVNALNVGTPLFRQVV